MEESNPYAPPASNADGPLADESPRYVPLRGRARLAAVAIALTCAASFLLDFARFATSEGAIEENVATALGIVGAGVVMFLAIVFAAVAYCVWIYAAAKNLRALGMGSLQASPGWCVGSFFVPFANLYMPYRAVREIWEASDPAPYGAATSRKRPADWILQLWWGAWLVAGLIGNISARVGDFSTGGAIGLAGSALLAIAGVTAVKIVNTISAGQERIRSVRAIEWGREP